jgi:hypothetical protein
MRKLKVILAVCALMVFGAGLVLGLTMDRVGRRGVVSPTENRGGGSAPRRVNLARDLGLSAAQTEQFKKIWSEIVAADRGPGSGDRWRALDKEREDAIKKWLKESLSPAQWGEYEQLQAQFREKAEEMERQHRLAFDEAVKKTKEILNPEQLQKYEEMLKKQQERMGGWGSTTRPGPGGPHHGRGGGGRWPTTQPELGPAAPSTL